jgi:hypothetical protein
MLLVCAVDAKFSPIGPNGERYLADGKKIGMRLWELAAGSGDKEHKR